MLARTGNASGSAPSLAGREPALGHRDHSHAPGQLEFLGYGAQRALDAKVPVDRIVNTWTADKLLEWTTS